jgi:glutamine amidotransferase
MKVAIIDYKMGNIESVKKTLAFLNIQTIITSDKNEILKCDIILLPGVGSFKAGMESLISLDLVDFLTDQVMVKRKPCIGICLGMHLMATWGYEPVQTPGLGWVEGKVLKIDNKLRLPHMGWNNVNVVNSKYIDADMESKDFYFIHSYHFVPSDEKTVASVVNYGANLVATLETNNIFATQFHPEKSQKAGLKLLSNYFKKYAEN